MVVKIIDPEPAKTVVKEVICKRCGVKLSYVPNDVSTKTYSCMGESDSMSYITCAGCKKDVEVTAY